VKLGLCGAAIVLLATGGAAATSQVGTGSQAVAGTAAVSECSRPYSSTSPWNTPIGPRPDVHPQSDLLTTSLRGALTSDPTQYTYPVYEAAPETVPRQVVISGWFSNVTGATTISNQRGGTVTVRVPDDAQPAAGSDGQLIVLDPRSGDEWGFWQAARRVDGSWSAVNGYHYDTGWSAVPPRGFVSRGAGVPYLAGLIRPCEIARGVIAHALAFAYDAPSPSFVYPATKSDGRSAAANAMPEGTRLQLDPSLTAADLARMSCTGPCLTIARALQEYGMYLIDGSGRSKVIAEYEGTAHWNGALTWRTVSPIPFSSFRVLRSCTIVGTPGPDVLRGSPDGDLVCGLEGSDVVYGLGGADILIGGAGRDVLEGGAGDDRLDAGLDADRLTGGAGADTFLGGPGNDMLLARDRTMDRVAGGPGTDTAKFDRGLDRLSSIERRP
jgi:hypothetical protein